MLSRCALLLLFVAAPLAAHAASQEQEYQQIRTIALRDSRVREAYAEADRRLEEKMLRIDPALAGYVRYRAHHGPVHATENAVPVPKKPVPPSAPRRFERNHVVLKGETLSSIATIFGVSVASLKTANHIADERKLLVGQTLQIPDRTR